MLNELERSRELAKEQKMKLNKERLLLREKEMELMRQARQVSLKFMNEKPLHLRLEEEYRTKVECCICDPVSLLATTTLTHNRSTG